MYEVSVERAEMSEESDVNRSSSRSSHSSNGCVVHNVGVKRKVHKENWKKENAKSRRNAGKSYVSAITGKTVKGKKFIVSNKCCPKKCFGQVDAVNQEGFYNSFWAVGNKNNQDQML